MPTSANANANAKRYTKTDQRDSQGRVVYRTPRGGLAVRCKTASGPNKDKIAWKPYAATEAPNRRRRRGGSATEDRTNGGWTYVHVTFQDGRTEIGVSFPFHVPAGSVIEFLNEGSIHQLITRHNMEGGNVVYMNIAGNMDPNVVKNFLQHEAIVSVRRAVDAGMNLADLAP